MELDSDIRSTPQDFFNYLDRIFNFKLDVCANEKNNKCPYYFTYQDNGLFQPWSITNWCNPPYSRGQIDLWLKKAIVEQEKGCTTVCLVPADSSTKWYQENILGRNNVSVWHIPKRLKFEGIKNGAKFANVLVIYWGSLND